MGIWGEYPFHPAVLEIENHETFIIGPDGKIVAHWPKAKGNEAHSEEVLEWIMENG